jgi:hypothetical protein
LAISPAKVRFGKSVKYICGFEINLAVEPPLEEQAPKAAAFVVQFQRLGSLRQGAFSYDSAIKECGAGQCTIRRARADLGLTDGLEPKAIGWPACG